MRLDEALAALGHDGVMGRRRAEVPVAQVVGTAERPHDFDQDFRLVNVALRERWQHLEALVRQGVEPPPVTLVQLGELYFVLDGHHRVSVARALGRAVVTADVLRLCTVAYAMCCLRLPHLPVKAAERRFLERVPLPVEARPGLWLDDPAGWARLADAAEAWAMRETLDGRPVRDRAELAERWWAEEVVPLLDRWREAGVGQDVRDVALYAQALTARDGAGATPQPA
jgi:hypothetical protein